MSTRLLDSEIERYARHVVLEEIGLAGVSALKQAKVLIVGLGGLGSAAAYYLAAAGVGEIGLLDHDRVTLSNLQRQILYSSTDLGRNKVEAAAATLRALNPTLSFKCYALQAAEENSTFLNLLLRYPLLLDCLDGGAVKLMLHDLALKHSKCLVHGAVVGFEAQLLTVLPKKTACLRCFFTALEEEPATGDCAAEGIFSPLCGILGSLQASEALKFFLRHTAEGSTLKLMTDRLFRFDARSGRTRIFNLPAERKANPPCRLCVSA